MASEQTLAIVARGPVSAGQWRLESVVPRPIEDDEVLVRIVASGICLADVHFGDIPATAGNPVVWYPRALGHEGSGYVEQIGCAVTSVKPQDPVILSYLSCGECYSCQDAHPAYCIHAFKLNFEGRKGIYASHGSQEFTIGGSFFGQSSFSNRAIVKERCVVNLKGVSPSEQELQILAPLGCGVQTGCGSMINIANVTAGQDVAILGVGGVGQCAIMAAAMRGCNIIIAIDRTPSRLQLAKSFGATHVIDTSVKGIDLVSRVMEITEGRGVHVSLDTTGVQDLARKSWDFVRCFGKILQVGLAKPEDMWDIPMADHMNSGKQIFGCVQGDAIPQKYVIEMIDWYRKGKLPVDKLVSCYPAPDFQLALADMRSGAVVKPVLVWSSTQNNVKL